MAKKKKVKSAKLREKKLQSYGVIFFYIKSSPRSLLRVRSQSRSI
ncbi:hypothetical protein PLANPX_2980 [Lacipirellula parvula]|uniref:Uncharacterized protein n=1 Tax=Lacipirellula parvula TaxID=2650471 RepID=A0A5K7X9Z5_9BACT|nr:hypothetical protein PLANPX_2980 [Lacipirellula parvula]